MVWRVIWLPVVAALTASAMSISPFLGQTEGSVVQRAGLEGRLVDDEDENVIVLIEFTMSHNHTAYAECRR